MIGVSQLGQVQPVADPHLQWRLQAVAIDAVAASMMGFDPMMQFVHEEDICEAISLALEHGLQGVFNVVGPGEVPLHTAIEETAKTSRIPTFRSAITILWPNNSLPKGNTAAVRKAGTMVSAGASQK